MRYLYISDAKDTYNARNGATCTIRRRTQRENLQQDCRTNLRRGSMTELHTKNAARNFLRRKNIFAESI